MSRDVPVTRWATALDPVRPSLLRAGRGTGWWWPGVPVVADPLRIWVLGEVASSVPAPDAEQVLRDGDDLVVLSGRTWVRIAGERATRGRHPLALGPVGLWVDEGFVYRAHGGRTTAIDIVRRGERVTFGPRGAALLGVDGWTRGGLPGRSPRPLARPLLESPVRWSDDGRRVAGLDEDEQGVVVDLETGRVEEVDGQPVSVDTWLRGAEIVRDGRIVRRGVAEASTARQGDRLAGPAGRLWSLGTGCPVGDEGVVALGVTVGTPTGFVTVDWATHCGWTVDPDGVRRDPFRLPLDEDDTVVAGIWDAGAVHLETALGERFRVLGGRVAPGDRPVTPPDGPETIESPAGSFDAAGTAEVGSHRFAWNDDGWLLAWPRDTGP